MRRVVDFPQPEGPSNTQNEPGSILKFTACKAVVLPQDLATLSSSIKDIRAV